MKKVSSKLIDKYGRKLNYLRLSITDRCNFRCLYCMPSEGIDKKGHVDVLTYEELLRISEIAVNMGVEKIRLTGGEPLIRKGIYDFLPRLTALSGLKDVSVTTNGMFLKDNIEKIRSAGINRLNISLDSLKREKFRLITGEDGLKNVWEGILAAEKAGFSPIKINTVVIKGVNEDEIPDLARLSFDHPFHIRFIEYMPMDREDMRIPLSHVSNALIKERLSALGTLQKVKKNSSDGPAERFRFEGAEGEIGFISALSNHFCASCNRLRLTATGHLRPCLLSDIEVDIKGLVRQGASEAELEGIFLKAASLKPHAHNLISDGLPCLSGKMSSIGG